MLQFFEVKSDSSCDNFNIYKLQYDSDCNFKEGIFANYWTTYSSLTWGLDRMQLSTWYMAINGRGHRVSAKNSKKSRPSAHFLPDPIEGKFIPIVLSIYLIRKTYSPCEFSSN